MENLTQKVERSTEVQEWIELVNKIVNLDAYLIENIGTPADLVNSDVNVVDSLNISYDAHRVNSGKIGIEEHGRKKRKDRYREVDITTRINNLLHFLETLYGQVEDLTTDSRETFVDAINELKDILGESKFVKNTLIDDTNTVSQKLYSDNNMWRLQVDTDNKKNFPRAINLIMDKIGGRDLNALQTRNRANLITAINEVVDNYKETYANWKSSTSAIGNIAKLKGANNLVASINSGYNKLGQVTGFYHSRQNTKVFGVEAINHYIDKIGIVPDDLTTVSRGNLVSALTEIHAWNDKGKWIYARTNQRFAIGKTTATAVRLDVAGAVQADNFKGNLEGNVTGNIIGNATGSVSGTSKSWKKEIAINVKGDIEGRWLFGGDAYKNVNWKDFYTPYRYYEKSGYYAWVSKTIKDGYWHKFQVKKKVDKRVSYQSWEPSGYNTEAKVLVKQGYWKNISTYVAGKRGSYLKNLDSSYNVAANGRNVKIYESDARGNRLKYLGTANNTKRRISTKANYIRAEVDWSTALAKTSKNYFSSSRLRIAQLRPFATTVGFKHIKDESYGIGMSAGSFQNKKLELNIPLSGNPTELEIFICCWHRSFEQSAYAWWIEDSKGIKHKIHAAGSTQHPNGVKGLPKEYQNVSGLRDDHIHKTFKLNIPNGAKKMVMRWVMNDGGYKKDLIQFKQLKIKGNTDLGPAAFMLETSNSGRVPELKYARHSSAFRNRFRSNWSYSSNWIKGDYRDMTLLYKTSRTVQFNQPGYYVQSKRWIDTSYYKTVTKWVDTSKFVTKYKTIQEEVSEDKKEWIRRDRVVQVKEWKDTSKWVKRYKIDTEALKKAEEEAGKKYDIFVQDAGLRGRAKQNHLHDDQYLKTGDGSQTKYLYISSCVGADTAWSNMNSIYSVSNYHTGSTLIAKTSCGGAYVWTKYKDGVSSSSWLRLK